ncbi:MAG: sulfatase-like hydrolase/transferase, partial [Gemmatimonadota bacterium]|nr:sulfatase-like hydrolase/transferase [Gemmatimonadota bacterium]
ADLMQVKDASDDEIRGMRALYYGGISFIDHKIGQMVQDLKEQHLYDDTWIIFTADHGEFLGDFHLTTKGHFHWQADRIPLIIKPPTSLSGAPRNVASDALVEFIDVATTIRDIAGGELSGDQGRSLLPILSGGQNPDLHRDVVHSQVGNTFMMMTEKHKIIFQDKDAPVVKAFYDVREDPEELHNILDQSAEEVSRIISTRVTPFFSETSDSLPPPWEDVSPWQRWDRYPHLEMLERL